jgi:hypothetical protein
MKFRNVLKIFLQIIVVLIFFPAAHKVSSVLQILLLYILHKIYAKIKLKRSSKSVKKKFVIFLEKVVGF